jgi:hypothetical protein
MSSENGEEGQPDYMELRRMVRSLTWRNYLVAFLLLALVMVVQVLLTDLPFSPYQETSALGRVVIADVASPIGRQSYISRTLGPNLEMRLEIDGQRIFEDRLDTTSVLTGDSYPYFEELALTPGNQQIRLTLTDPASATTFVFYDAPVTVSEGDILTIPPPSE